MAYVLAASAAFVNALTSVLQRIGVETAPDSTTMRLSLMRHAIKRGIWLIGFALMLVVFGLQATALRFGELSVVQPVLTTELLFLLLILGVWFRYRLGWKEWLGSAHHRGRTRGLLPGRRARRAGTPSRAITSGWWPRAVLLAVIAGFIVAALRGPRWWRAASFGAATAVTAAYTAALTKAITTYTTEGWGHVLTHFQPYMLAVCGLGTVFLLQNALHAGPITASRTTLVTVNPLVSIVLGITLFADHLRGGVGWVTLELAALAVLVAGVVILARSPLVAGTHEAGDLDEMLGGARHRARAAGAADAPGVPRRGTGRNRERTPSSRPSPRSGAGRRPDLPPPCSGHQPVSASARARTAGGTKDPPGHVEKRASARASGEAQHVVPELAPHRTEQCGGDPGVTEGAVVVVPAQPVVGAAVHQGGPAPQSEVVLGHQQGVERRDRAGHRPVTPAPAALGPQEGQVEAVDVVAHHHPA